MSKLILIDGSAVAYRSHFAFIRNPLINSRGENTSAIFGFVNSLNKLIADFEKFALQKSTVILTVCQALSEKAKSIVPNAIVFQIEDIPIPFAARCKTCLAEQLVTTYKLSGTFRVVYTGNLQSYQGIDLLLDAWDIFNTQYMRNSTRKCKLVMVGGPLDKVQHYRTLGKVKDPEDSISWIGPRPTDAPLHGSPRGK